MSHKDYYKATKDLTDIVTHSVIKAQDEIANEVFERWETYIGVENCDHDIITEQGLREWSHNPHREYQCVFCSNTFTIDQLIREIACPNCREYKVIIPYIVNPEKGHV